MTESEEVTRLYPELEGATITRQESLYIHKQDGEKLAINGYDYRVIPDTRNKYFSRGKMYNYFTNVREFLESDKNMCVVPLFVQNRKTKGRRYFIEVIDEQEVYKIFNVEHYNGQWVNNEHNSRNIRSPKQGIEICKAGQAYTFMIAKESESVFGFRVVGVKE